jgi:hypothetical protein
VNPVPEYAFIRIKRELTDTKAIVCASKRPLETVRLKAP